MVEVVDVLRVQDSARHEVGDVPQRAVDAVRAFELAAQALHLLHATADGLDRETMLRDERFELGSGRLGDSQERWLERPELCETAESNGVPRPPKRHRRKGLRRLP